MELEEEIDRAVGGVVWNASNYPEIVQSRILGQDTAPLRDKITTAVMPLVRKAQAEARVAELREMADNYVDLAFLGWPHNVDAREVAEYFEDWALTRADAIEQNSEGNEAFERSRNDDRR